MAAASLTRASLTRCSWAVMSSSFTFIMIIVIIVIIVIAMIIIIIVLVPHLQLPHQRLLGVHEGGGVLLYLISLPILQSFLDM